MNLKPITLDLKVFPGVRKMYLYIQKEVVGFSVSKVITGADKHADRWTDRQTG